MAFVYVQSPAKANEVQNQVQVDLSFSRIQFLVVSLKSCKKTLFTFYDIFQFLFGACYSQKSFFSLAGRANTFIKLV